MTTLTETTPLNPEPPLAPEQNAFPAPVRITAFPRCSSMNDKAEAV